MSAVATPTSPFKGLAPFGDSDLDALLFFGRARETEVIAANLQASRLTVLFGPSGVGKSSILRAGVGQRLRREADTAVEILDSWAGDAVAAVHAALAERPDDGDLYLVLDQFEEYFLYHAHDTEFPGALADIVTDRGLRVNVLIGIRDDALARLDTFRRPIPNLLANRLRLDRLDRDAAREAILGPVARYNELTAADVAVEPSLVDAVLDQVAAGRVDLGRAGRGGVDARDQPDRVEAPYLQLVLERLWEAEREVASSSLRVETLERLGGASSIVRDHLEHAMAELTPSEKEAAAAMYNHLVTPSGTKIAHRVGDLAGYAAVDEPEAARILSKLARERIVRGSSDDGPAATRYEIFHDVLGDAVLAWRARHEEERALEQSELGRKRAHRLAAAALAGLVLVAGIAVFALVERGNARAQARHAHARELAAQALTELEVAPAAGLRTAYEAARLERGEQEEDVLRRALVADRLRATFPAGGPVSAVAFSPSGSTFLAAGADGRARLYRRGSRTPLHVLEHGGAISAASFSADGGRILTAGIGGSRLWSTTSGELLRSLGAGPAVAASFARGGRTILTASATGRVQLWRARDGRRLRSLVAETEGGLVNAVVDPAARFAVTVTHDRFARVYSLTTGRLLRRIEHEGFVGAVTFSPNGTLLMTAGYTGTLRLWRAGSWRLVQQLLGGQRNIPSAVFSRDGSHVAAASADGTVRIWEVATGLQLAVAIGHRNEVTSVAFNPDATAVVSTSSDGTARVWGAVASNGGRPVSVLAGHRGPVVAAAFSADGRSVVTAGDDGTTRLWDPGSEPDLVTRAQRRTALTGLAVDPRSARLLVAEGDRAEVLSPDGKQVLRTIMADSRVTDVAFGPEGARVATAPIAAIAVTADGRMEARAIGGEVRVTGRGRVPRTIHPGGGPVHDVAFSPDGRVLGIASDDGTAELVDTDTGRRLRVLRGHSEALFAIAFSADGKRVATASADRDARVWEVETGRLRRKLHGHFGPVKDVRFSGDGRRVVTAGPTTAGVWETERGQVPAFLRAGVTRPFSAAAFGGPDGRLVIAISLDGTLRTYYCEFCGGVDELMSLARRRISAER